MAWTLLSSARVHRTMHGTRLSCCFCSLCSLAPSQLSAWRALAPLPCLKLRLCGSARRSVPTSLVSPLLPDLALWVPPMMYPVSVSSMSFLDRTFVLTFNAAVTVVRQVAAALGVIPAGVRDLDPALYRGRLVLVNSVPGLDYPQALPPLIQYTGPVLEPGLVEPFTPDVEAWLEAVPEGKPVVYVSYGTVAVLSPAQVRHMAHVFAGGGYHTLWALPESQQDGLPDQLPPTILVRAWVPTPRALMHPKVRAFVSHCGGNSVSESMSAGTPIVGYPQFGDQVPNCLHVADAGAGITALRKQSWVKGEDIEEVLSNPAYEQRAQSLQRLFSIFGGAKKAADLLELGASGDLAALAPPPSQSLGSWVRLNGLDLVVFGMIGLHCAVYAAGALLRRIWVHGSTARCSGGGGGTSTSEAALRKSVKVA